MGNYCQRLLSPQVPLTSKGQECKDTLEILLFVHIGLAVTMLICLGGMYSYNDFIASLILFLGVNQHNYCNIYIYLLLNVMSIFKIAYYMLYTLQLHVPLNFVLVSYGIADELWFAYTYCFLMFIFYVSAIYFAYQAYRELKGIWEDEGKFRNQGIYSPFDYGTVNKDN